MIVDIYVEERNGSRSVRMPWLPERVIYKSGGVIFAEYDIMNTGPVSVPTGTGLAGVSWESEFPGKYRTDKSMLRGSWKEPKTYHNIFEEWRNKRTPLRVIMTGYPINIDCYIEDYEGEAYGGFGDWKYNISFIETRSIKISSQKVKAKTVKRSTTTSKTYTVKSGDCLWSIAERYKDSGTAWRRIYEANKSIIETTAKKRGLSSSDDGWWIFPGTVLTID